MKNNFSLLVYRIFSSYHSKIYRETKEECGLDVAIEDLDRVGVILFEFVGDPQIWEVHVFRTTHYSGIMIETDGERISLIHVQ